MADVAITPGQARATSCLPVASATPRSRRDMPAAGPKLEALAEGRSLDELWAKAPDEVASCGAFPIRAGDEWVATFAVSGLHNGLDHEVVLRSLEQALGATVPRWSAPVA